MLAAVIGPEVRAGAVELLRLGLRSVSIDDDGRVEASLAANELASSAVAERVLVAFERILGSLPRVTHSGKAHPAQPLSALTKVLGLVGAVGWATNVGFAALAFD